MENLKIEVNRKEIVDNVNKAIQSKITEQLSLKSEHIDKSISEYFDKGFFVNKISQFDSALDWTIEAAFRESIEKAMEELNFKELIAKKAKELLQSDELITKLAEAKVRSSLGI